MENVPHILRVVLTFIAAALASAGMLFLSPMEDQVFGFVLWMFLFVFLAYPASCVIFPRRSARG